MSAWGALRLVAVSILVFTVSANASSASRTVEETTRGHRQRPFHNSRDHSTASSEEVHRLLSQIAKDLLPWKASGITLEMVERAYCSEDNGEGMRIQVVRGQVFVVPPASIFQTRSRTAQAQIAALSQHYELPDLDFILYTSDICVPENLPHRSFDSNYERCPHSAPLISTDKLPDEKCILAPDFTFGGWPEAFLPAWPITWGLLAASAKHHPWEQRDDTLFWKGAATSEERKVVADSARIRDSNLTNVNLIDWDGEESDFAAEFVSLPQHCHHKYLLHMSGFTYSARLKYLLSCGSAVIFPKSDTMHEEFWYHMLNETNHVAISTLTEDNDGQPLLDAIQNLRSNPEKSRQIGEAARHLAKEVLHPDNIDRFWLELFSQYSALQRFQVRQHPDAVPLEALLLRPDLSIPNNQRTCTVC